MADIVNFPERPISAEQFMRKFREDCAKTGSPADPNKCVTGMPGTITTSEGDVLWVGES